MQIISECLNFKNGVHNRKFVIKKYFYPSLSYHFFHCYFFRIGQLVLWREKHSDSNCCRQTEINVDFINLSTGLHAFLSYSDTMWGIWPERSMCHKVSIFRLRGYLKCINIISLCKYSNTGAMSNTIKVKQFDSVVGESS